MGKSEAVVAMSLEKHPVILECAKQFAMRYEIEDMKLLLDLLKLAYDAGGLDGRAVVIEAWASAREKT